MRERGGIFKHWVKLLKRTPTVKRSAEGRYGVGEEQGNEKPADKEGRRAEDMMFIKNEHFVH